MFYELISSHISPKTYQADYFTRFNFTYTKNTSACLQHLQSLTAAIQQKNTLKSAQPSDLGLQKETSLFLDYYDMF